MHVLDIFLFFFSLILIALLISKQTIRKPLAFALLGGAVLVIVLQLVINGMRWQLYPLYIALFALLILAFLKTILEIVPNRTWKKGFSIVLSLLIFLSAASAFVFPVYSLPEPNGPDLIGTESIVIVDESRFEQYGTDSNQYRRFKIQIWYPAETVDGYSQEPWIGDGLPVARAISKDYGLPSFALDHIVDIMSHAYIDAPISEAADQYPVVVISHGWSGTRFLHTDYAEALASRGYIVVGIEHTYGSVATVFGEDDIAYRNADALPPRETTPDFLTYANQLVYTYAGDVTKTLDYLEEINASGSGSRFSGRLDLTEIGFLGHSTGGGGDVAVALNDDRVKALMGLDAWVEPIDSTEIAKGLDMPSLFIRSGAWETGNNNENLYSVINHSSASSILYQIDGTTHYDFAMVYMYSPLTRLIGFSGSVDEKQLIVILKTMITDFFNQTLKHDANSAIDISGWKDVRVIPTAD